jgi:Transglutaminase-like superfamily
LRPATFFLRQHVFLCRDIHHWVILDVAHDKYSCVDRRQFESLGPWLHGWEGASEYEARADDVSHLPADARELAGELLSAEILSDDPEGTKDARAIRLTPSTDELAVAFSVPTGKSHWYHVPAFFLSCVTASLQLRKCPFRSIITNVGARKQRNMHSAHAFAIERARTLVEAFDALRPWYPRPYLCMFDSLALLNFLAWYGLFPEWVFGVTAEPFKAHCWVRAGTTVLNDTLERAGAFTPIMQV